MAYNFDTIATHYDRLNHVMTGNLDKRWRIKAAEKIVAHGGRHHLDVAIGTGDLAAEIIKQSHNKIEITGIDLSEQMIAIARKKIAHEHLMIADAENMPFDNNTFDSISAAFGIRNFLHLDKGLSEMVRVLKDGGLIVILELSTPDNAIIRPFYNIYAHRIIPRMGQCISGNRDAYNYLVRSVDKFPKATTIIDKLHTLGVKATQTKFLFGTCRMYIGTKTNFPTDGR